MIQRMIRASRLDRMLYREVAADPKEMTQAVLVILLVAIASGIGTGTAGIFTGGAARGALGFFAGIIGVFISWVFWSYITYAVGRYAFEADTSPGAMMRAIGFAQSPAVLNILGGIPCVGGLLAAVVVVWTLVASFIAVRETLRLDNTRTLIAVVAGFIVALMIFAFVYAVFGAAGSMFGVFG
ncbi:MAG: YIP1 family protein [Anaerolineae bacterium]